MNEDPNIPVKILPNNFYFSTNNNVHFKILVPAISAGGIIGKGGESINQMQKETNTKVKISKSNDFYPGTKERVCLIIGSVEGIIEMHSYIMSKINDKLVRSFSPENNDQEMKMLNERQRQVKILVPNSTAGLIIGKSGTFIKDIKETTGAFVQISQKAKEINLLERCIIVAGEFEHIKAAIKIILLKISQDPQSKMCPNISYVDICGPVPSAFPTGSPYATVNIIPVKKDQGLPVQLLNVHSPHWNSLIYNTNNSPQPALSYCGNNNNSLSSLYMPSQIASISSEFTQCSHQTDQNDVQMILKRLGYSDNSTNEILMALQTLDKYGLLGKSYCLPSNISNINSNDWFLRKKLLDQNKLKNFSVNYPCYRNENFNNIFFMPSFNELQKNINFYPIPSPDYRTLPSSSISSNFLPFPMSLQIAQIPRSSVVSLCNYQCEIEVSDYVQFFNSVIEIENRCNVKIHIKNLYDIGNVEGLGTRLLTLVGNEENIIQALRLIRESVSHGTESQITNNRYQSPGDLDANNNNPEDRLKSI